ncbi:MAG: thiamine pyrophosphate-dependent enzyme [Desulfobacterales bacterium]|jgi:pyruvate/2-oxoacid:ferredoxin oxidoreductase beta subunit/Pyruvate/2-oxoacid:ferredoxin oxidoreductase gamma subunit|nr:2-oxoacid:acceptor oxidoreductase family protein [Deltaproteobacteria bacterium]
MNSLLNAARPPLLCPGCAHERITHSLDQAFQNMKLSGSQIVIVSDIGCSGLFDTFFHTHAMHGLHGRALTYAAGLKMARPELNVVVTMGDGGQGIGGAHLLAACRRNLDLTLLILNNFNFGMTGGQFSATTPSEAQLSSGFLSVLERPLDIGEVARCAGAPYVRRCSGYQKNLPQLIQEAVEYKGFALMDIWGICPGRYTKKNRMTPKMIDDALAERPPRHGIVPENVRPEYGQHYRQLAAEQKKVSPPATINSQFKAPQSGRQEVILLGSAGQRIITAGELLCIAGLTAGMNTTQKNEYNITVLRGPSISELILSPQEIDFTGIETPDVVLALDQEGVDRRRDMFARLTAETLIIQIKSVSLPECKARIHAVDLKAKGIKRPDWALAALAILANLNRVISVDMLIAALKLKFKGNTRQTALSLVKQLGSH